MNTDERIGLPARPSGIATHVANADRLVAERDAQYNGCVAWLWTAAIMGFFALMAAWGYSFLALGCRGWACLLPGGM